MKDKVSRVVLDTNVVISGLIADGPPSHILGLIEMHRVEHCTSQAILDELTRVLRYPRIAKLLLRAKLDSSVLTNWLAARSRLVTPQPLPAHPIPEDPDDEKFLACALAADPCVVVSGDRHLLNLGSYLSVEIMSARSFMERWL